MKRTFALLPFVLLFGCGPSTPAESPAPTTTAEAAPTATAEAKPAETAAPAKAATATVETKPAEPPPPAPPNVTGTLGGKELKVKSAITMGPLYQGRVLIALANYDAACDKPHESAEGEYTVALPIEWKQGDVAFAISKDKKGMITPQYTVASAGKKGTTKVTPTALKPTGKVELAATPTEVGKSTRLKLDLTSGKDTIKGDIELFVCWEIKEEPKK